MTGGPVRGVLDCPVAGDQRGGSLDLDALRLMSGQLSALDPQQVGAVVLRGGGRNFCTGGDVGRFAAASEPGTCVAEMAQEFHEFVQALVGVPVPVVAEMRGWAAGAGLSLLCLADLVVAGRSARFRAAYGDIGLSPDGGLSWTLPRVVGLGHARRLLLDQQVWGAEEAVAAGLVHRVVDDADVATAVRAAAQSFAAGAPALGRTRRLLWDGADRGLAGQLAEEVAQIGAAAASAYSRAAVQEFLAARADRPAG